MSKPRLSLAVLLCLSPLAGCSSEEPDITSLPRDLTQSEQQLIDASGGFGFKLLQKLAAAKKSDKNLFVSPLSVEMALGMVYGGAATTTASAMQKTLGLDGMSLADVNASHKSLIALLEGLDASRVKVSIANSVWYRTGLDVAQSFIDDTQSYFGAKVSALDFSASGAADTINQWVSDSTSGLIKDIVDSPIDDTLVMFLINAIYFKGNWSTQFDPGRTAPASFTRVDGSTTNVQMMSQAEEVEVRYARTSDLELVDLPYGGRAFTMTVILPQKGKDVFTVLGSLDAARLKTLVEQAATEEVTVRMPKFKLEFEAALKQTLSALGMEIAFDSELADFSRITSSSTKLFISEVKHKTYVDVNEEGTEAAAVTSVGMAATAAPYAVTVDRPYLVLIRERFSGTILFLGLIVDPSLG
jgi:serine protease inhibitor